MEQLRACGVLETIRISAAGYPSRCPPRSPSTMGVPLALAPPDPLYVPPQVDIPGVL